LASLYGDVGHVGIGVTSAIGSAALNNHPMSLLNMLAIDPQPGRELHAVLAALVGGDLGPRMMPWGSLAGLLWFASLRRLGVQVTVWQFVRIGLLVTAASLPVSLGVLQLVSS
jgi:arsenical pump membrane protein